MKKTTLGFMMLMIALCAVSCKNSSSPSSVAENFAKAMTMQNYTAAKQYVVSANAPMMDQMAELVKQISFPDSLKKIMSNAVIKVSNEKITDSTATVDVTITLQQEVDGQKEEKQTMNLKKENGIWKIDLGAPDMMQGNMQQQPETLDEDTTTLPKGN